jgi:hypothetical protein
MGEITDTADTDDLTRPRFRGCVFCYTAQLAAYGVRKLRRAPKR